MKTGFNVNGYMRASGRDNNIMSFEGGDVLFRSIVEVEGVVLRDGVRGSEVYEIIMSFTY